MSAADTAALPTYMTPAGAKLPFCPGCSHERLLKELDRALVTLGLAPREVVIVTDIGCIGLSDQYFVTNAFHGLHGRSLTYATGLKLARPELTVIVLIGDGGCGIGGAHLLNAARRNLDLTLIVANNFNYGMTGGQHSVTTPGGGRTATTPAGNIEGPMDICATVKGAGATWIYRGLSYDADLDDRIVQAIRHPGFALLDIWELCTAYYLPRNSLNKKELYAMAQRSGAEFGLLCDIERAEFGASYRRTASQERQRKQPLAIEPRFRHNALQQTGIVIAGAAGQKVKSTSTLLAKAGMLAGLHATQKDDYPITVMTGHSVSEVILSPEPIDYTAIDSPAYFVVVSEEGLKKTRRRLAELPATCTVVAEDSLELPATAARIVRLPLKKAGKDIPALSIAIGAVGAMLRVSPIVPMEAFEAALRQFQQPGVADASVRAFRAGAEMAL